MAVRLFLSTALLILQASSLTGQQLSGRVVDDHTGAAISGATVNVRGSSTTISVTTDSLGAFHLGLHAPGVYRLAIEAWGYLVKEVSVSLENAAHASADLRLVPSALALRPVVVHAPGEGLYVVPAGMESFAERMAHFRKLGLGKFLTRPDLEGMSGLRVSEAIAVATGARLECSGLRCEVFLRSPGGRCRPKYYLNGTPFRVGGSVDGVFNLSDLEAVEVYRGAASLPGEFMGSDSRCGVIVLWTRRGA